MKVILQVLLLRLFVCQAFAQCPQVDTISNGIRSNIINSAGFSSYPDDLDLIIDNEVVLNLSMSKTLWLGALDVSGNLELAASDLFVGNGRQDYYSGPIDSETKLGYIDFCRDENRIWKFDKTYLENFMLLHVNGDLDASDLNIDMLSYPAKGNQWYLDNLGVEIKEEVAPFYDQNSDGIYNPLDGDRPICLKEKPNFLPFQFSYTVFNDIAEVHSFSQGRPIGAEIHLTSYIIKDDHLDVINQSVFTRYKVINKSFTDKIQFYYGIVQDHYLDCFNDNYFGCDTLLNLNYHYQPETSTQNCNDSSTAVRVNLFLNQDLASYGYFTNAGIGINNEKTHKPQNASQFYNFLQGLWNDGSSMSYGELGCGVNSTMTTKFVFPDCPSDESGWSLEQLDPGGTFRTTVSSFSGDKLIKGAAVTLDFVDFILYDPSTSAADKICNLEPLVEDIKDAFNEVGAGTSQTNEKGLLSDGLLLYPNPASTYVNIQTKETILSVELFNVNGKRIRRAQKTNALSVIDLAPGVYFLNIKTEKGLIVKKMIKT